MKYWYLLLALTLVLVVFADNDNDDDEEKNGQSLEEAEEEKTKSGTNEAERLTCCGGDTGEYGGHGKDEHSGEVVEEQREHVEEGESHEWESRGEHGGKDGAGGGHGSSGGHGGHQSGGKWESHGEHVEESGSRESQEWESLGGHGGKDASRGGRKQGRGSGHGGSHGGHGEHGRGGAANWYGRYHSFYQKSKWCKCWIGKLYGKVYYSFQKFSLPLYKEYPRNHMFKYWAPKVDYQSWCSRRCSKYCTVKYSKQLKDHDALCKKIGTAYHWEYCTVGCYSRLLPNDRPNHIWDMDAHPGIFCCAPTIVCNEGDIVDEANKRCLKLKCTAPCLPSGEYKGLVLEGGKVYDAYPATTSAKKIDCKDWDPKWGKKLDGKDY